MAEKKKVLILGGDDRQRNLNRLLNQKNINSSHIDCYCEEEKLNRKIEESDMILLPLPLSKDGILIYCDKSDFKLSIPDLKKHLSPEKTIAGGMISKEIKKWAEENTINCFDFFSDEGFAVQNAYLTAQGALRLLLDSTDDYIVHKKILITGFGRVAKATADMLKALKADVYISARKSSSRRYAQSLGFTPLLIEDIDKTAYIFDFIINTVPSVIFSEKTVSLMKSNAVFIELASKPYGAVQSDFEKYGIKNIRASSLPGKFLAKASADIIYEATEHIFIDLQGDAL